MNLKFFRGAKNVDAEEENEENGENKPKPEKEEKNKGGNKDKTKKQNFLNPIEVHRLFHSNLSKIFRFWIMSKCFGKMTVIF